MLDAGEEEEFKIKEEFEEEEEEFKIKEFEEEEERERRESIASLIKDNEIEIPHLLTSTRNSYRVASC